MVSLVQLEYIVAVDTFRHFATAAEKCFVTQPTLSMQIKKMEDELGVNIFDRGRQPIIPTDVGIDIIEQARNILREAKGIEAIVANHKKEISGELRIGVIPSLAPYLLPLFMNSLAGDHPNLLLKVREMITDDIMVDDFVTGHLDANVRLAIAAGLPAEEAIYTATYTPARRMGFQDRGAIMTGYQADFILLDDVPSFKIATVYKNGKQVSTAHPDMYFPESFYQSVQCRPLTEADLSFKVEKAMTCNVIAIQKVGTFTEHVQRTVAEKDGFLDWENSGLALIFVMERYGKNGNIGYGFVENALNEKGAIATTWAHDHHNVMIMGTSIADILAAQHAVLEMQGGYVVSVDGVIAASCPLPIGGILSDEPVPVLGKKLGEVRREMQRLGYKNTNEIMSFSTLSLPVSPKLKITDFGMMDVHTHELIPLMER